MGVGRMSHPCSPYHFSFPRLLLTLLLSLCPTTHAWLPTLTPWPSYPPPLPLWALHRPTRAFLPFFGPPPPDSDSAVDCSPNLDTGNLPLHCIDIIQVRAPYLGTEGGSATHRDIIQESQTRTK